MKPGRKTTKTSGREAIAIGKRLGRIALLLRNPANEVRPLMLEIERIGMWLEGKRDKDVVALPPIKKMAPKRPRAYSAETITKMDELMAYIDADKKMDLKRACKDLKANYNRARRYLKKFGYTVHTERNEARSEAWRAAHLLS